MTAELDGNAIAGLLYDVFGAEMTAASGSCTHCGARSRLAECVVYLCAPGTVIRCRECESVLMVVVIGRGTACVDARGLTQLESIRESRS